MGRLVKIWVLFALLSGALGASAALAAGTMGTKVTVTVQPGIAREDCLANGAGLVRGRLVERLDEGFLIDGQGRRRHLVLCHLKDRAMLVTAEGAGQRPTLLWNEVDGMTKQQCRQRVAGLRKRFWNLDAIPTDEGTQFTDGISGSQHWLVCHAGRGVLVHVGFNEQSARARRWPLTFLLRDPTKGRSLLEAISSPIVDDQGKFDRGYPGSPPFHFRYARWLYTTYPAGATVALLDSTKGRNASSGDDLRWVFWTYRDGSGGWRWAIHRTLINCARGTYGITFTMKSRPDGHIDQTTNFGGTRIVEREPKARSLMEHAIAANCGRETLRDVHIGSVLGLFSKATS